MSLDAIANGAFEEKRGLIGEELVPRAHACNILNHRGGGGLRPELFLLTPLYYRHKHHVKKREHRDLSRKYL